MSNADSQTREDEVLKRMLKTPPTPFTPKKDKAKPSRVSLAKKKAAKKA